MPIQQRGTQVEALLSSGGRFRDSTPHDGGAWMSLFDQLSPSGRHYAISHSAFELFSAFRSADSQAATCRAFQLNELACDRGVPDTLEAIEALAIALTCYERCDALPVQHACVRMIRAMVCDGLINATPLPNTRCG